MMHTNWRDKWLAKQGSSCMTKDAMVRSEPPRSASQVSGFSSEVYEISMGVLSRSHVIEFTF